MFGSDPVELFRKGGPVMWPLLACSVLAVALIVERTLVVVWAGTSFRSLLSRLKDLIQAGKIDEAAFAAEKRGKPVGEVARAFLKHWHSPAPVREDVVGRVGAQQIEGLERRLNWLATLAQVTPLLGLLGTVLGLMSAFQAIDAKGANVHAADLAVGIWAKLINTAFGLAIAIPCLVVYYWLETRILSIANQMEWMTSHLNEWLAGAKPGSVPSTNGVAGESAHAHAKGSSS
jgi:biopolymer transport protein ExbB